MKIINIITWAVLFMTITSCNINNNPPTAVDLSQDKNNAITVFAPSQVNTFKIDDFVTVVVQNNTEHEISITQEGILLSVKNGNDWIEVENLFNVRNRILSSKDNKDYSLTMIAISPNVTTRDSSVVVRITITGVDQLTNEKLEGHVDVILFP